MSGFLRRLAAGVTDARPATHPFVESSYAFVPPEAESSLPTTLPAPESSSDDAHESPLPPFRAGDHEAPAPASPSLRPLARPAEPLAARAPFRPLLAPAPAFTAPARGEPDAPSFAPVPDPLRDEHAAGPSAKRPLVAADPADADASTAASPRRDDPRANALQPRLAPARPAAQDAARVAPARAEPNEIQIHIGRIEVVALPSPAPRAAPPPAPKGLDLGAYLRRKGTNGGAG
ncbi:MAG TPA: hypothetical protein VGI39_33400 [Polyangiaceae bacterium]|jgi:hypothetical protein